jgi:hypothetical protein
MEVTAVEESDLDREARRAPKEQPRDPIFRRRSSLLEAKQVQLEE